MTTLFVRGKEGCGHICYLSVFRNNLWCLGVIDNRENLCLLYNLHGL